MITDGDNSGYESETSNNERSQIPCIDCVLRALEELILILMFLERRNHPPTIREA